MLLAIDRLASTAARLVDAVLSNGVDRLTRHSLDSGQRNEGVQAQMPDEARRRPGLTASGMFLVNPPHTLKPVLAEALPQVLAALGRGRGQGFELESGS